MGMRSVMAALPCGLPCLAWHVPGLEAHHNFWPRMQAPPGPGCHMDGDLKDVVKDGVYFKQLNQQVRGGEEGLYRGCRAPSCGLTGVFRLNTQVVDKLEAFCTQYDPATITDEGFTEEGE